MSSLLNNEFANRLLPGVLWKMILSLWIRLFLRDKSLAVNFKQIYNIMYVPGNSDVSRGEELWQGFLDNTKEPL
jgi:hypothetical protein